MGCQSCGGGYRGSRSASQKLNTASQKSAITRTWRVTYRDGTTQDWIGGPSAELAANREAAMNGASIRLITTPKETTT